MDRNLVYLVTATMISLLVGRVVQGWHPVGSDHRGRSSIASAPHPVPQGLQPPKRGVGEAHRMQRQLRRDQERIRGLEQSRSVWFRTSEASARHGIQLRYQVADLEETVAQFQRQVSVLEALLRAGEREKVPGTFVPPGTSVPGAGDAKRADGEARALEDLGIQFLDLGWFQKADEAFYRALSLSPMDPDLHYNLGVLADRILGEPGRALYHFRSFVALAPEDPDAPTVAGWVKQRERD